MLYHEIHHADLRLRPGWTDAACGQRRIDDQAGILRDLSVLRERVKKHFGRRYHGDAFEEWVRDLFDGIESRLKECREICRRKKATARSIYS
jgi:hypothetical protein